MRESLARAPGPGRRGVLLYFALGLMLVLAVLASMLYFLAREEEGSAEQVYKSEALTAMGEAVLEEAILQIVEQLNIKKSENKIYFDVREASNKEITIDKDYLARITPNSRAMLFKEFGLDKQRDIVLKGRISKIVPFDVKGFTDKDVLDPIEKHGTLELEVSLRWQDQDKVVSLSRPFKVVKCVMPVLSECTLFVNNAQPDYFGYWPSCYGYDPKKFPDAAPSLVLDNGWHGYSKFNKKTDFIKHLEDDVIESGRVPPGRVFINKGIVPLTNGDRASGALQKTFFSGESELLPQQGEFPLKVLKEEMAKRFGFQASTESSTGTTSTTRAGTASRSTGSVPASDDSTAIPGNGELFVRYVGHGEELKTEQVEVGSKKMDGYGTYFGALAKGAWATGDKSVDPGRSGLDLYGRVAEKKESKGESVSGEGFFAKLFGFVKKITSDLLSKLYSKYDIRISPTLVYGDVVHTYFRVMDYVETGWLEKMKNTFTLNPNQFPLPAWPDNFLESKDENKPLSAKSDLPADWPEKTKERWLKLPEDVRKPKFHKIMKTMFPQFTYGLPNDFQAKIPAGAFYAHYNEGLLNFLTPDQNSKIRTFLNDMGQRGIFFLKNETDREIASRAGCFWRRFSLPLTDFNPFLFYVKATDYISSLWDPRDTKRNIFYEKYYDKKDKCFDIRGVVYITGTEDLVLGNSCYRGKSIIITFGRVVFNGAFTKKAENDKPEDTDLNANLTIVTLGGVVFDTSARIDAQIYSYIYPPAATSGHPPSIYGALACNTFDLTKLPDGGQIVFDYTYHIPPNTTPNERDPYYHVAITNEISRYGYSLRRDVSAFSTAP